MISVQIIITARNETISSRDDLIKVKEKLFIMIKNGTFVLLHTEQILNWQSSSKKLNEPDLKGFMNVLMDGFFSHGEKRFKYLNCCISQNIFPIYFRQLDFLFFFFFSHLVVIVVFS